MRSKLVPKRKYLEIEVLKFIALIIVVTLIVTVTALLTNKAFNYFANIQLEHIENAHTSTQTEPQSGVIDEVETLYLASEYERALIESCVMAEASNQGLEGMEAVSQVILDRSVLWNMTPAEVVTQEGQFATYEGDVSEECRLAVSNVFDLGVRVFDENVTHFHDDSINPPYWTENKQSRGSVGRLSFYY